MVAIIHNPNTSLTIFTYFLMHCGGPRCSYDDNTTRVRAKEMMTNTEIIAQDPVVQSSKVYQGSPSYSVQNVDFARHCLYVIQASLKITISMSISINCISIELRLCIKSPNS